MVPTVSQPIRCKEQWTPSKPATTSVNLPGIVLPDVAGLVESYVTSAWRQGIWNDVKEFTQHDAGAGFYSDLDPEDRHDPLTGIWALVDSNRKMVEPALVFQGGPFFVVEATSIHPDNTT